MINRLTYQFGWLLLLLFGYQQAEAQINFIGKPGYMTTPSAMWYEEKRLGLSFGYVPRNYSKDIHPGANTPVDLNTLNFYNVRAGITRFMEINFTVTYRPLLPDQIGIGDRQVDFRFHLLREKKYRPSLVLGITPPGSSAPFMSQDYLVATKNIAAGIWDFQFSLGYGSPYVIKKNTGEDSSPIVIALKEKFYNSRYLVGFFGGMEVKPVEWGGLMVEYNTSTINAGAFVDVKDWLTFSAYTFEGKSWAFNVALQFGLDFKPKELRAYEKNH
ncbi:YjbH domain-containing protein [Echinicola strongylocentroti]|nr:YjbH domain-containing protein [Echinicola strongylocentroti]